VTYLEYGYEKAWGNDNEAWNIDDNLGAVGLRVFICGIISFHLLP
jgi:hypothetical protein